MDPMAGPEQLIGISRIQKSPVCLNHTLSFFTRPLGPGDFPGKNTGVGCHSLLQETFPTQGLNLGLPHCRQMLNCLSHQGSPLDIIKTNVKDRRCTVLAIDQSGRCSLDLFINELFICVCENGDGGGWARL